jgi:predicted ATP-dependent endonuclease of OLD family
MKISRFECENVHGYLSFQLAFNPDLTFLTGINGSGKTTTVRAITALLTPSLRDLANIGYSDIAVEVEHERPISIRSHRSDEEITLSCSGVEEVLRIPVLRADAYEPRARFMVRQRDFYREQEAINARNATLLHIESLPTPMFLDLERRYQGGVRQRLDSGRVYVRRTPANPLAGSLIDSLNDAQGLAERTFRQFLAKRAQLTDELKQEIILTAFEPSKRERTGFGVALPSRPFMQTIERNEEVVARSLSEIGISADRITATVQSFFRHVNEVAARIPAEKELEKKWVNEDTIKYLQEWSAIHPQLRQINRLVELISKYNDEVRTAMDPVERYRTSVNGFLSDSGKELMFDDSGNLRVAIREDPHPRPITALSSGERQLVVILTHLAFNPQAKRANVLIIDEPELSLHLRWQELFVDAIVSASKDIQLILATHSPSIILGRQNSCVDLEEARRSDRVLT